MDDILNLVKGLSTTCKNNEIEVEARIRRQLLDETSVSRLTRNKSFRWKVSTYTDRKRSSKQNRKCTYRRRCYDDREEVICKSSLLKVDVNDKWCSVFVSTETPIPSMSEQLNDVRPVEITRHRGETGNFYVDVIMQTEDDVIRVEIEAQNTAIFCYSELMEVTERVCVILQDSPCFMGYYDWKVAMHVVKTNYGSRAFCIDKGQYQKPVTMTMVDLSTIKNNMKDWVVTPKVDGIRRFVLIVNGKVFDVDIAKNIRYHGKHQTSFLGGVVLDAEYLDGKYYIFDVVVFDNRYCGDDLYRRTLLESMELPNNFFVKPYEQFRSFDKLASLYEEFRTSYVLDGLIFMNIHNDYMQSVVKWKMLNTVDLQISDPLGLRVFTSNRLRREEAQGKSDNTCLTTSDGKIVNVRWKMPENQQESHIWEFGMIGDELTPVKPRPDKRAANSAEIVQKTLYSAVSGEMFTGKGCYLMRKSHNRIKGDAIRRANDKKAVMMDVGTGQGGDIGKWKRASKVYCVEPKQAHLTEIERRASEARISDKIVVFSVPLRELNVDLVPDKIDIFTAFFCTNLFEKGDWTMLKKMIKKNGSKKCRILITALTDPRTADNGCFTLKILGTDRYNISIHGTRIVNISETVVKARELDSAMKECGMEKAAQIKLNADDFMTQNERKLSSMYTLFVYSKS